MQHKSPKKKTMNSPQKSMDGFTFLEPKTRSPFTRLTQPFSKHLTELTWAMQWELKLNRIIPQAYVSIFGPFKISLKQEVKQVR